jgi:hypothetical protein
VRWQEGLLHGVSGVVDANEVMRCRLVLVGAVGGRQLC